MSDLKTVTVGTVLFTCWGYDQTNYDFYQVVARRGQSTLVVRQLKTQSVTEGRPDSMCTLETPLIGEFDGEPLVRRVNKHGRARIESYSSLLVWDGKPKHATHYA